MSRGSVKAVDLKGSHVHTTCDRCSKRIGRYFLRDYRAILCDKCLTTWLNDHGYKQYDLNFGGNGGLYRQEGNND